MGRRVGMIPVMIVLVLTMSVRAKTEPVQDLRNHAGHHFDYLSPE